MRDVVKSGGNITVLVDHLENQGLVARDRDLKDRRIIYDSLTQKGEALFDGLYSDHLERIREAIAPLFRG